MKMGARHHGGGGTRNAPEALEALLLFPLHVAYHPLGLGPNPATTTTLALLDIVSPPRPRQHQTRRAPTQASHFACPSDGASHAHLSSRGDITSFAVPASTKSRSKYDPRARRAAADAAPTPPPTHHHMRKYMYARQATRGLDCTHAGDTARPTCYPPAAVTLRARSCCRRELRARGQASRQERERGCKQVSECPGPIAVPGRRVRARGRPGALPPPNVARKEIRGRPTRGGGPDRRVSPLHECSQVNNSYCSSSCC